MDSQKRCAAQKHPTTRPRKFFCVFVWSRRADQVFGTLRLPTEIFACVLFWPYETDLSSGNARLLRTDLGAEDNYLQAM